MPGKKERILVLSIDFDGCLFNFNYLRSESKNRLIEANEIFIQHVLSEIKSGNYERVIFMIGSNRQSKAIDITNSAYKGSAFPALVSLCEEIKHRADIPCEVNKLLLADIYGDRPKGENFDKSLNEETYDFSHFIWDKHKTTIVYPQLHDIAADNKEAEITYVFIDDLDEILDTLASHYQENVSLIPSNTEIKLFQYNGKEMKPYESTFFPELPATLKGSAGIIDAHYRENLKLLSRCCGYDGKHDIYMYDSNYGISGRLSKTTLKRFKNERIMSTQDRCKELAYELSGLEKKRCYPAESWDELVSALKTLSKHLSTRVAETETDTFAKATVALVRELQDDNIEYKSYENKERNKAIHEFIDTYGMPLTFIKSNIKFASNLLNSLFTPPSDAKRLMYDVAEKLKAIVAVDELEFTQLKAI